MSFKIENLFGDRFFCRGLFEVLKCGRKTDKIDKKALEAIFVVVLGSVESNASVGSC